MDLATIVLTLAVRVLELQLQPPRIVESVTVVRELPSLTTPSAVTRLDAEALRTSPSLTLDDTLRSVPGFSLFRRSSSRVANPTTQGVTLRGLAASGSSRALVLADDVPLNDPVGGWVYWNRIPAAALAEVSVARGAAGDLHGADALAGVVSIRSRTNRTVNLLVDGGGQGTARLSAYAGNGRIFTGVEGFTTDGFVIVGSESRGPADTPAASRHGSGFAGATGGGASATWVLRGAHTRESRGNGTALQENATTATQVSGRLFRASGARDGWSTHGYALVQDYRQTFSAVTADRTTERLTSEQDVAATAAGASTTWSRSTMASSLAVTGAARHTDGALDERSPGDPAARRTSATQSTFALAIQGSTERGSLSMGAGLRTELWRSGPVHESRLFATPRLWLTLHPDASPLAWTAAYQSGYRAPTINELYRPFRVGSIITEANARLRPERAKGVELGVSRTVRRTTLRLAGFWSRVDDAIVNVTLSAQGNTILRQRRNAAGITSAGLEAEAELRPLPWLHATASASYTHARFTSGDVDGLRLPQVPNWQHSAGVRVSRGPARVSADWRFIGRQFDDDRNAFELAASSVFDVRAGWVLPRALELFASVENALDEEQEVGRTPLRTLGLPRLARVGLRWKF